MSLLDHPEAQALLADAVLTPEAVRGCRDRLTVFLGRDPADSDHWARVGRKADGVKRFPS